MLCQGKTLLQVNSEICRLFPEPASGKIGKRKDAGEKCIEIGSARRFPDRSKVSNMELRNPLRGLLNLIKPIGK